MEDKKINIKDNKKIVLGIAGIIIIVIIIAFLKYLNNPVVKFKQNLDNVDVSKLQEIYSTTQSYDEKKKIEKIFNTDGVVTVNIIDNQPVLAVEKSNKDNGIYVVNSETSEFERIYQKDACCKRIPRWKEKNLLYFCRVSDWKAPFQ